MRHGRYPKLNNIWETDVSNLFYIGTAMAATDRKASSGFIHGFRYNIRTLFRLLEERLHGVPLPSVVLDRNLDAVADKWIGTVSSSMPTPIACDRQVVPSSGRSIKQHSAIACDRTSEEPGLVHGDAARLPTTSCRACRALQCIGRDLPDVLRAR